MPFTEYLKKAKKSVGKHLKNARNMVTGCPEMDNAQDKFNAEGTQLGIPYLCFYCVVLSRLAYFTPTHFMPAYLEIMGPIIPDKLLQYIDNAARDNNIDRLLPDPADTTKVGQLMPNDEIGNVPTYTFPSSGKGNRFVDFTKQAEDINEVLRPREKKPNTYLNARNVSGTGTIVYMNVATSNYGGTWIMADTRMPHCMFVIFRGTYSAKSAGAYTKPQTLRVEVVGKDVNDGKKYGVLGGMDKLLNDDLHAIIESMGYFYDTYLKSLSGSTKVQVITTGHSLGGGLCTLFSMKWPEISEDPNFSGARYQNFQKKICCVSVAAPRVLSHDSSRLFCRRILDKKIIFSRVVGKKDPICAMPSSKFGYSHPCSGLKDAEVSWKTTPSQIKKSTTIRINSVLSLNPTKLFKIKYKCPLKAQHENQGEIASNPFAHVEYLYIRFLTAVPLGAFMDMRGLTGLSSKDPAKKSVEIARTAAGHTMVRYTLSTAIIKGTTSQITYRHDFVDLNTLRTRMPGGKLQGDVLLDEEAFSDMLRNLMQNPISDSQVSQTASTSLDNLPLHHLIHLKYIIDGIWPNDESNLFLKEVHSRQSVASRMLSKVPVPIANAASTAARHAGKVKGAIGDSLQKTIHAAHAAVSPAAAVGGKRKTRRRKKRKTKNKKHKKHRKRHTKKPKKNKKRKTRKYKKNKK